MAIDYQRILMDMNRPARRRAQGKSMKKIFLALFMFAVVFAGTFAAWQYGFVHAAWSRAHAFAVSVLEGETPEVAAAAGAEPPKETRGAMLSAMVAPLLQTGAPSEEGAAAPASAAVAAPPKSAVVLPPQNDSSPIDVASQSSREPKSVPNVPAAPVRPQAPSLRPVEVVPVLSDAKAQIRVIDGLLSSNPSEALRRLDELIAQGLEPDDAAEAGYRRGYAARMLRDEATAERAWRETADQFPGHRGGRFSAMALGDTWFHQYAGARSQLSRWDDISVMYSRALGRDDAPFLPEQVKAEIKRKLGIINDQILFGSAPTELARYHKVEPGELLGSIANKYRIDYESIARVNSIDPNRIRVGMDLKLVVGDVDVVVRKYAGDPNRTPTVTWFIDGRWAREYPACVGDGAKTPAGAYTFTLKERDPSWTNPVNGQLLPNDHPENILGSRWMAMKGMNTQGLGIHGTTVDDSIPGYTSAGCVRLHNKDVEELFSFGRIGGKVTILE